MATHIFTLDDELDRHFRQSSGSVGRKLSAFPRFVNRSSIGRFIVRYEIFKPVLSVQGSIIECGVHDGFGLFAFAEFSVPLEPMNHRRRLSSDLIPSLAFDPCPKRTRAARAHRSVTSLEPPRTN